MIAFFAALAVHVVSLSFSETKISVFGILYVKFTFFFKLHNKMAFNTVVLT